MNCLLVQKLDCLGCYVFSVLQYGFEIWALTRIKIEAFALWLYRRMLKISRTDCITNQRVLERMRKDKELLITNVKAQKLEYMGHITRNSQRYKILQFILQEKIEEKKKYGKKKKNVLVEESPRLV